MQSLLQAAAHWSIGFFGGWIILGSAALALILGAIFLPTNESMWPMFLTLLAALCAATAVLVAIVFALQKALS